MGRRVLYSLSDNTGATALKSVGKRKRPPCGKRSRGKVSRVRVPTYQPELQVTPAYAPVLVDNINVLALIDSGAAVTLISDALIKTLKARKIHSKVAGIAANSLPITCIGYANVKFNFGKARVVHAMDVPIVKDLSTTVIIGNDILTEIGANIDLKNFVLGFEKSCLPLYVKEQVGRVQKAEKENKANSFMSKLKSAFKKSKKCRDEQRGHVIYYCRN